MYDPGELPDGCADDRRPHDGCADDRRPPGRPHDGCADGHPEEAAGWLKRALEVDPGSADVWCALGSLQAERREWVAADAAFRHVLTKCEPHEACKRDAYAQLGLANILYTQYVAAAGSTNRGRCLDVAGGMSPQVGGGGMFNCCSGSRCRSWS